MSGSAKIQAHFMVQKSDFNDVIINPNKSIDQLNRLFNLVGETRFIWQGRKLEATKTFLEQEIPDGAKIIILSKQPASEIRYNVGGAPRAQPQPRLTTSIDSLLSGNIKLCVTTSGDTSQVFSYTGQQLKYIISLDPFVILLLLQFLSQKNPYILSYIATNPVVIRATIDQLLDSDEFRLEVRGFSPLETYLEKNRQQLQKDETNINEIERQIVGVDRDRIKDLYLFFDRNPNETIRYLQQNG